ncbi:MAG TPA: hypothetical protein VH000_10110, partial [Rhizomicrobium sp.]|nr:hypothetical protein [Rhizomicrobium sp.]
ADTDCSAAKTASQRFDAARCAELAGQARDSTRGEKRIVDGASHMIQYDKPQVVLDAFAQIIRAARDSGLATAERR